MAETTRLSAPLDFNGLAGKGRCSMIEQLGKDQDWNDEGDVIRGLIDGMRNHLQMPDKVRGIQRNKLIETQFGNLDAYDKYLKVHQMI